MTNYCAWPDIPEFARPHFPIVPLAMLEQSVENLAALVARERRNPGERRQPTLCVIAAPIPVGAPGRTRTCDPLIRSQPLYPLSYGAAAPTSLT